MINCRKKVDLLLHESFAENPHDFNQAQIELPFKQECINLPNNHQYALNRMLKLEQRLKRNDELKNNYFKFMGELFKHGHAVLEFTTTEVRRETSTLAHIDTPFTHNN